MPYVATRTLRESLPTGEVVTHEMGAVLTRFETWNYAVRAALLRRQDVVEADESHLPVADTRPAAGTAPAAAPVVEPATAPSVAEVPAAEASAEADLNCPHCPGKKFVNRQGLRLHTTRMHKAKA